MRPSLEHLLSDLADFLLAFIVTLVSVIALVVFYAWIETQLGMGG